MEVRPGYKQTEAGLSPEEWTIAPLGREVDRLDAGVSVNSVDAGLRMFSDDKSVLKTSAIAAGQFFPHECKTIAPRDLSRVRLSPRADSILISRMNTPDLVGECGYVKLDYPNLFLPDRLWMTSQRSGSECCALWLTHVLSSRPYRTKLKALATGTSGSMKNIAKRSLLELAIAFPPPSEQRAIATALSDVDALLGALDRLIIKKRDLKQAAVQQLLTGQTRLPGFNNEWESFSAGEIGRFRGGNGFPLKYQGKANGIYPFFKVSDMNNEGNGIVMRAANHRVSEAIHKQLGLTVFPADSIVFAKVGAAIFLERKKILGQPSCIDNNMTAFVLDPRRANARFVHMVLLSKKLGSLVSTTALPSLNGKQLSEIPFRLPPLSEQSAIAAVLTDMDAELVALEQRREKTRALKQGMMQELLTGKTRLISREDAHG